jgi:sugar O-acyltransferase (sialic acid O-acetyltransferase NeuD family)
VREIFVFGAGGHAKVVIDAIETSGAFRIRGVVAFRPVEASFCGYPVIDDEGAAWLPDAVSGQVGGVVAIGDNWRRSQAVEGILKRMPNFEFVAVIHPRALVARDAKVLPGAMVLAGAVVNPGVEIGLHAIVNTAAVIEHDVRLENFASVAPGAILGGNAQVAELAAVGLGASVIHGVQIGRAAVIGAGAVVVDNIPGEVIAYGVPCRSIKGRRPEDPYL